LRKNGSIWRTVRTDLTKRFGAKNRGLPLVDAKLGIGPADAD
jgi:hypothetical protein